MKKILAFVLTFFAIFSLAGCEVIPAVGIDPEYEVSDNVKKSAALQEARNAYTQAYAEDMQDGIIDGRPVSIAEYAAIGGIPTFQYEANGYTVLFDGTEWTVLKGSFFTLTRNDDFTYSYRVVDANGNLLFENENFHREPKITVVAPTVYGLVTQTGTGISTNWAVFCDVQNCKTSEYFYYVLAAKGDYVIYVDLIDLEPVIIVQNIFDKAKYYQEYKLEDPSPVAADIVNGCQIDSDGDAICTYYAGDDYTLTEIAIDIP